MAFLSSKAGHWHFSCLQCSQVSGFISGVILICLNAISKSRLAHQRCINLLYLIAPLPLPVCSFLQRSLTPCSSSVRAAFPTAWAAGHSRPGQECSDFVAYFGEFCLGHMVYPFVYFCGDDWGGFSRLAA